VPESSTDRLRDRVMVRLRLRVSVRVRLSFCHFSKFL